MTLSFKDPRELTALFSEAKLKQISSEIIRAYKRKDWPCLYRFAASLDLSPSAYHDRPARLFKELILFYHPDRRRIHHKNIHRCYRENNRQAIEKLARSVGWGQTDFRKTPRAPREAPFSPGDFTEEYRFDRQDFSGFYTDDPIKEKVAEHYDFMEAAKDWMYGNLFSEFDPRDLASLDGELILAEEGLEDLNGLEYCVNLSSLNLSGNRITGIEEIAPLHTLEELDLSFNDIRDIDPLAGLASLVSLDLSFNRIEEISCLLDLPDLQYVNLSGNPGIPRDEGEALAEQCLVIF